MGDSEEWNPNEFDSSTQKSKRNSQDNLDISFSSHSKCPKLDYFNTSTSSLEVSGPPNNSTSLPPGLEVSVPSNSYSLEFETSATEDNKFVNPSLSGHANQNIETLTKLLDALTMESFMLLDCKLKLKLAYFLGSSIFEEMKHVANKLKSRDSRDVKI